VKFFPVMVLVGVMLGTSTGYAAEKIGADEPALIDPFQQGTWTGGLVGGYLHESFGGDGEDLYYGGVEVEYFWLDDLAIVGELLGYHVDQSEDTTAFGLNLLLRWHFWKPCKNVALYLEGGAGIIQGLDNIPSPEGTYFNFTQHVGLGGKIILKDNMSLLLGGRYFHLSNASIKGSDRNPSIDAFGGYGAFVINF